MEFKVLAHCNQPLFTSLVDLYYFHFVLALLVLLCVESTSAQVLLNGQVFTNGFAILNSPAPQSQLHAGSNMSIAIDRWKTTSIPGSGSPTGFDGLEIYLLSYQASLNITVSAGTALLTQETGSTVKHLDWPIPSCIPAGQYNLTLRDFTYHNQQFFAITPVPIQINNSDELGSCTFQHSPQSSCPPPTSPWIGQVTESQPVLTNPATPTSSGMVTHVTSAPDIITITLSVSGKPPFTFPMATVTASASPMTVTVVYVSLETILATMSGQTDSTTSTIQRTSTETRVVSPSGVDTTGFVPVNASTMPVPLEMTLCLWVACVCTFFFILWGV